MLYTIYVYIHIHSCIPSEDHLLKVIWDLGMESSDFAPAPSPALIHLFHDITRFCKACVRSEVQASLAERCRHCSPVGVQEWLGHRARRRSYVPPVQHESTRHAGSEPFFVHPMKEMEEPTKRGFSRNTEPYSIRQNKTQSMPGWQMWDQQKGCWQKCPQLVLKDASIVEACTFLCLVVSGSQSCHVQAPPGTAADDAKVVYRGSWFMVRSQ